MQNRASEAGALDAQFAIEGQIGFATMYGGPVAVLRHEGARAVVALQGAQVLSYETVACGEILWLGPNAMLGTGKAVRGGIPICWPWFGPHPEGGDRPSHGFVRAKPWIVASTASSHEGPVLSLQLPPHDATSPDWPVATDLRLEVRLTGELTVTLTTRNHSDEPIKLTSALHTYFAVSDIDGVRITGLEGTPYIDKLDAGALKRDPAPIHVTREVDRIYQEHSGAVVLTDPGARRIIRIGKSGSRSTVVWNPWIEKSARLGDMGEDGYRRMVCIETANAGSDVVTIAPHAAHALSAAISAERLP